MRISALNEDYDNYIVTQIRILVIDMLINLIDGSYNVIVLCFI